MIYIVIVISVIYTILIIAFISGFNYLKNFKSRETSPKNTFTIVVAFRNEVENLPKLLQSLSNLNYPANLFEILLVNDNSTDAFEPIIAGFKKQYPQLTIVLLNNKRTSNSPKKDAISVGIQQSKFDWIVTTDADCEVPKNWLTLFNEFIEDKKPLFISAPVSFKQKASFLFHFQNLNFISLIGSTIGGFGIKKPFMCNGANLCYSKKIFNEINGFVGNETIASGDDIFLLEKMIEKHPNKTLFLKSEESVVLTNSALTWKQFFNQQIRWASKSTSYKNNFAKFVGIMVFLENLMIFTVIITTLINPIHWKAFFIIFIQKMFVDFLLIEKTSKFLKNRKSLIFVPITSLLYPFYILFVSLFSTFKKYEWKGRVYKK
ncbi:glycosyltransferase family 2 protein [Lutibacter maritimus]|uniref:Glycosyltransferase, catalytic subunit of cellulose synthase and poly-beta-1,6-N-acetylglucosamine synthase n=1 Tax=Lutibacter maritimus TaxID=593133 RepID=A0A1I6QP29_9FLAO|nr:glycosyltransferase [Lutibacter maritimus]SFS54227.1 Glycosyltransferase, catalytic subunit of cellulose synthase and poly-beta-1,6-N-acetylglucosamine synthase [Lutibacter maritimus]